MLCGATSKLQPNFSRCNVNSVRTQTASVFVTNRNNILQKPLLVLHKVNLKAHITLWPKMKTFLQEI